MSALKNDTPIVFELVPIEDRTGFTEDEAYALLAGIGPQTSTAKLPPVTAAFDPHQLRGPNGRWIDEVDSSDFTKRLKSATSGRRALKAAKSVDDLAKKDPVRRDAATYYLTGGYKALNTKLRTNGDLTHIENVAVDRLDAMMRESPLDRDVVVTRGIASPQTVFGSLWKNNGDNTGLHWRDNAYVSTTVQSNISDWHAQRHGSDAVVMTVLAPKGTPALHLDDAQTDSRQLLLSRGLTYRIIRDYGIIDGTRKLDVEVVS